ncbi:MAG: hypothetical protein ACHQHN_05770 [Sphingobacteriales bacterium]
MKRTVYYLLLLAIIGAAVGCKKDKIPVSNSLAGTWELSLDVNGMTGYVTHHKPGNDTVMKFNADGSYAFYDHNKITRSGNYTIRQDTFYIDHTLKNRIIYDHEDSGFSNNFFDISNNQLSFFIDAYDAGGVTYRRIK